MFNKIKKRIKEIIYGKNLYNLDIKPVIDTFYFSRRIKEYLDNVVKIGFEIGYLGKVIITEKGFILKGEDKNLETKIATLDLTENLNSAGIMNLDIVYDLPITDEHGFLLPRLPNQPKKLGKAYSHIHIDGSGLYNIIREKRRLKLA